MKIYDQFEYKGARVRIQESSIARGNQYKSIVNGMSLGCLEDEAQAKAEAIRFIDSIEALKTNSTKGA